jgi:hypothetical protein
MKKNILFALIALIMASFVFAAPISASYETDLGATALTTFVVLGFFSISGALPVNALGSNPTAPAITADYFNNYITTLDLNARKVLPQLYRRFGTQGKEFFDTIHALGFVRTDGVDILEHYEEEWIWNTFTSLSQTATGGGAYTPTVNTACRFTLAPESVTSDNKYFPQIGHAVLFPNDILGVITAINVTTPSAPILTVAPVDATDTIPAVAANTKLAIITSYASEGSGQPSSILQGVYKWQNSSQTIKSKRKASGRELATESWIQSVDGEHVGTWANKGFLDLEYEQQLKIQGAFLSGKVATSTLAVDGNNANASLVGEGTRGLIPEMNLNSEFYPYTPGAWEMQDFYNFSKLMKKKYTDRYAAFFVGLDLGQELDQSLFETNKDTAAVFIERAQAHLFGNMDDDGRQTEMAIGFKYVTVDGFTFCIKNVDAFYHPKLYGADTYDYNQRGFVIPLAKRKDPKTKNSIPTMGIVYRGLGGYSRRMKVWETGANARPYSTDENDVRNVNMMCEFFAEFFGSNRFINVRPQ